MSGKLKIRTLICTILLASTHLEAQKVWTYSEEVHYDTQRDPGRVFFQDGREVRVRWGIAGQLTFEETDKWPKSKRLLIAYNPEEGTVLLDPDSGKLISVLEIEKHPIDLLVGKCLETELSTRGMVGCFEKGLSLWDKELNRLYSQLMKSKNPTLTRAVQAAQREWLRYRDSTHDAIGAAFTEGTISQISRAIESMKVTKEQTQRLQRLVSECYECQ